MKKILILLAALGAAFALSTASATALPGIPSIPGNSSGPELLVRATNGVPTAVYATNRHQSRTLTIVFSSLTPSVCTVPANSHLTKPFAYTPQVPVSIVGTGTCTLAADYVELPGHTERSFVIR